MRLSLITAPTEEPMSVAEAKDHLRVDDDEQDQVIDGLIKAARFHVETITGRQLTSATWEYWLDAFPRWASGIIYLPKPPLTTLTSITYLDANGVLQTWASTEYRTSKPAGPLADQGRVTPAYNVSYPTTYGVMDAVKIRFDAGYGAADVPQPLLEVMHLLLSHWFENREAIVIGVGNIVTPVPLGVASLLAPYKVRPLQMVA